MSSYILNKLRYLKAWNQTISAGTLESKRFKGLPADYISCTGLTRSDILDKIYGLRDCCNIVEFREYENRLRLHNANFCKNPAVCPLCASRLQSRRIRDFKKPFEQASKKYPYKYHVIFTVRDGESLSKTFSFLKESILQFRKMGQKRKGSKYSAGEWSKVGAGVLSYEIKRGENSGAWHVHAHSVLFCSEPFNYQVYDYEKRQELEKKYGRGNVPENEMSAAAIDTVLMDGKAAPVSKLSREWFEATGGQAIDIEARPIENIEHARVEVLKYLSKMNGSAPDDVIDIIAETHNKRFLESYRDFRCYKESYEETEKKNHDAIFSFQYDPGLGVYGDLVQQMKPIIFNFTDMKENVLKAVGRLTGMYRRNRRAMLDEIEYRGACLAATLNKMKETYRSDCRRLWEQYRMRNIKDDLIKQLNDLVYQRELSTYGIQEALTFT